MISKFYGNAPLSTIEVEQFEKETGFELPKDYARFLQWSNGGEGLIGQDSYVIFWQLDDLMEMNKAYQVEEYAPGLFLFGSNGGGEAFAFDARTPAKPIVSVPFVGMELRLARIIAPTFLKAFQAPTFFELINIEMGDLPERAAKEIWEIQPVILGGNPTDPANKTLLTRAQHIEAVRYWNRIIRGLRKQQPGGAMSL